MNINKFFNLAKTASKFSDYNKKNVHIGAVLVYKNKIIANGWNSKKTNPIQYQYNKYRESLKNNRFYSIKYNLDEAGDSSKCPICEAEINKIMSE